MTRTLFVDLVGGAAGDMLLAALLDAGAPEDLVMDMVERVIPGRFRVCTIDVRRRGVRARYLQAEWIRSTPEPRRMDQLVAAVRAARLPEPTKARALSVLARISEAEATVHGVDTEDLVLHELGDDDTLLDVVGVAAALDALGIEDVLVSSIPLGTVGAVTLELLRGFDIRGVTGGETVTPTAAAVFAALGRPAGRIPEMTLQAVGYGAGARDTEGTPNVVRVLVGATPTGWAGANEARSRELVVMEANLDDLSPELVADAARALFVAGAVDAWTTPALMKKGRPGILLCALCEPDAEADVLGCFFEATSTFGVRSHRVRRAELARRTAKVTIGDETVRVKMGLLGERVMSVTPEHDDVAAVASRTRRPVRDVYEEAATAARALRYELIEE